MTLAIAAALAAVAVVQLTALSRRRVGVAATRAAVSEQVQAVKRGGVGTARSLSRALSRVALVLVRGVPLLVGCAALLVAADWGLGAAWQSARGPDDPAPAADLAARDLPPAEDARIDLPAMAASPWADRYFAELEALDFTYLPYVGPQEAPVHGRYINSAGGIRASYDPQGVDRPDALEVWFFGGSAMWGEGQRDGHTIASEVARLAERSGRTLRVRNFGERGYSAYQELLVFEQALARLGAPDLAVFYHGFNELSTQTEAPENLGEQPTIFQLAVTEAAMERAPALPGHTTAGEPSVRQDYVQTSAVHKLLRGFRQLATIGPAGADEPFYVPPPAEMAQAVDHADAIYRRTMPLIEHVADEHAVPIEVFWQPCDRWLPYDELTARVARLAGGIDLSGALDDPPAPVYIDGVHTNELGARLVAEAMWPHLADRLAEVDQP